MRGAILDFQEKSEPIGDSLPLPLYVCIYCGADITDLVNSSLWYNRERAIVACRSCLRPATRPKLDEAKMRLRLVSLTERTSCLEDAVRRVLIAYDEKRQQLHSRTPWIRIRLFGFPDNDTILRSLRVELNRARDVVEWNRQAIQWLQGYFTSKVRSARREARDRLKRKLEAERAQALEDERKRERTRSYELAKQGYDRHSFLIISTDYRRGNAIDNYFRKRIAGKVLDAFNHCCAICGSSSDLTFDHCGIPKNEGGNFALLSRDGRIVRVNIVVLCRSCNSAKGQIPFEDFFNQNQKESIIAFHEKLLALILDDSQLMKLLKLRTKAGT